MKLKYYLSIAIFGLMLAGCIKEKGSNLANGSSPAHTTVDFIHQFEVAVLDISPTASDYTFYVEVNSTDNKYPATTVTIAKQTGTITSGGNTYEFLPDSAYTLLNTTATVDPTTHLAAFKLKINSTKVDLSHSYALQYKITSVSDGTIATNKQTTIIGVTVKNKYDGRYTLTGTLVDVLAPGNSSVPGDPYPYEVDLVTVNANQVNMEIPGFGIYHLIANNSYYGEFGVVLTFNTTTDAVTAVTNYWGQPSPTRARAAQVDPTGLNKRNADKSIDVKYMMTQAGALKTNFTEKLVYIGPRP
jgi:hypothetical protein